MKGYPNTFRCHLAQSLSQPFKGTTQLSSAMQYLKSSNPFLIQIQSKSAKLHSMAQLYSSRQPSTPRPCQDCRYRKTLTPSIRSKYFVSCVLPMGQMTEQSQPSRAKTSTSCRTRRSFRERKILDNEYNSRSAAHNSSTLVGICCICFVCHEHSIVAL